MSFDRRADRLEQEFTRFSGASLTSISSADLIHGVNPAFRPGLRPQGPRSWRVRDRLGGESLSAFTRRARAGALGIKGASRLLVGGLGSSDRIVTADAEELPAHAVVLPDLPLHPSQLEAVALIESSTTANPHLPADEIEGMRRIMRPEIAAQELDAAFVDVSGSAIIPLGNLLLDGKPFPDEGWRCQYLGVAIDSNSGKGGEGRDGAAAVVFAQTTPEPELECERIILLDWTILSLTQGGVTDWLESVRAMAMDWFDLLKPMSGHPVAYIEPAGNGPSLFEVAFEMGFYPRDIDSRFVMLGKDNRALAVEPHATHGRLKIGTHALDKRMIYRGMLANHLVRQVTGFKAFDREAYKREDDLFDATAYAALVGLGDARDRAWVAHDLRRARAKAKAAADAMPAPDAAIQD
jgi:hypothetical protein